MQTALHACMHTLLFSRRRRTSDAPRADQSVDSTFHFLHPVWNQIKYTPWPGALSALLHGYNFIHNLRVTYGGSLWLLVCLGLKSVRCSDPVVLCQAPRSSVYGTHTSVIDRLCKYDSAAIINRRPPSLYNRASFACTLGYE